MTEIVERLERQAINVENDGHVSAARAMRDAATALTEARAEIERLRRDKSAGFAFWRSIAKRFCNARKAALDRALAAESELSTLRARVREVVSGMLAHSCVADAGQDCKDEEDEAAERAARQLMEDLK